WVDAPLDQLVAEPVGAVLGPGQAGGEPGFREAPVIQEAARRAPVEGEADGRRAVTGPFQTVAELAPGPGLVLQETERVFPGLHRFPPAPGPFHLPVAHPVARMPAQADGQLVGQLQAGAGIEAVPNPGAPRPP